MAAARQLLTVVINGSPSLASLPEFETPNDAAMALARQGKPFRLLVTTGLMIPEGSQLILKIKPGSVALMDGQAMTQLPADVRNALSHALVRQINPTALLQQLIALNGDAPRPRKVESDRAGKLDPAMPGVAKSPGTGKSPGAVGPAVPMPGSSPASGKNALEALAAQLDALIPDLADVTDGDGIRRFLHNSGLFFESDLAKQARSGAGSALPSDTNDPSASASNNLKGLLLLLEKALLSQLKTGSSAGDRDPAGIAKGSGHTANEHARVDKDTAKTDGLDTDIDDPDKPAAEKASGTATTAGSTRDGNLARPAGSPAASVGQGDRPSQSGSTASPDASTDEGSPVRTEKQTGTGSIRPDHGSESRPATLPATPGAVRSQGGLAMSHYQTVQKLAVPAAATPSGAMPPQNETALPVPGLELPLPLRSATRRTGSQTREEAVPELLQQTRDTLARTTLHQLASAGHLQEEHAAPRQVISFDLPVQVNGQVHLFNTRIEHEEVRDPAEDHSASRERRKEKLWTVSLGFDIEGLGPMFCQLSLLTRDARLQVWAEHPATHRLAESHRDTLEKGMSNIGVTLREMACHNGMPRQVKTQLSQTLVDIST
jgi:hypothetical protein